ncbi:MAG: apolipoprotein N-acyltransferase, partial [Burkholderiales bacterium]
VPLNLLGTAQVDNIPLTQVATVTGVYGVSFAIMVVNASFAAAILLPKARRRAVLLASLSGAAALQAGMLANPPAAPSSHTAVLLQHNISLEDVRWTAERFNQTLNEISAVSAETAARNVGKGNPQLIAWPESPAPFYETDPHFRRHVSSLAVATGSYVVVGDMALQPSPRPGRRHQALNSASLFAPDGNWVTRYDKIHLVPFGEYVPYEKLLFFAGTITREVGDFGRGSERKLLPVGDHRIGLFICYESVFPGEVREFAAGGADVLMNISNDTWLDGTRGPEQHLNMARMRAIENRRWLLRPTNTGITASIDPYGRMVAQAPRGERTALEAPYGFISETTFYTRHGDVFAWTCAIISIAAVMSTFRRKQA